MKNPVMLVCAVLSSMTMSVMAADQGAGAGADKPKAKHEMTPAQREEMMNKRLEAIKAKDEALYKELIALKEKDPEAFKAKMRELAKANGKAHGEGHGEGHKKGAKAPEAAK